MNDSFSNLGRCISIFDRLMKMYYDRGLAEFEIGWGQQFYVEYLYDHPGASPQEMVEYIRVDKATLTKLSKSSLKLGISGWSATSRTRRVKHLYLTEKALPAARRIKEIHAEFYQTLSAGISPAALAATEQTLQQITDNINRKVWHRMEGPHGV